MPLVPMKEMLTDAMKKKYAVGAFNVHSIDTCAGVIQAAEETRSPVILAFAPVFEDKAHMEDVALVAKGMAERSAVPTVLHLDHANSLDFILRAIRCGFTSVMYDGSVLPFEENVAHTRQILELCRPLGITVEAELGHVGIGMKEGSSLMTDPEEARNFVKATGVDALAVSIGNAHGQYKGEPKLDLDLLAKIHEASGIPLVLHGGSGIPDKGFKDSIKKGISKINIWTEMSQAAVASVRELVAGEKANMVQISGCVREAVKGVAEKRMKVFGSQKKA